MRNDQIIGTVRTIVQLVAGWLTAQAVMRWGIDIDTTAVEVVLLAITTGLWRSSVSALAGRWPWLEWLNGWGAQPAYLALDKRLDHG